MHEVTARTRINDGLGAGRRRRSLTAGRGPYVLQIISAAGPAGISVRDIAEAVGTTREGLQSALRLLYGAGLVNRYGTGLGRSPYTYTVDRDRVVEALEELSDLVLATKGSSVVTPKSTDH